MKKLIIISAFILLICRCNDSGSSSKSAKGLSLNPDSLPVDQKFNLPQSANSISFGGAGVPVNYTIIYTGKINSIEYIGIAMSDNPLNQTFNLKIYFQGTAIPSGSFTIDSADSTIKAASGTAIYKWQSGTLTFDSFTKNDITTDNEKSYVTYTIAISGTATLVNINNGGDTKVLTFPDPITARLAGADDSSRK